MLTALDLRITFWWINATTYLAFIEQSFYLVYKSVFNEPWKRWLLNNSLLHSSSTASNYIVYNYIIARYNVCPTIPVFYYCTALWHQRKSPFHFHSQPLSFCLLSQHKCTWNCTFDCWMHQTSLPASAEKKKIMKIVKPAKKKGKRKVLCIKGRGAGGIGGEGREKRISSKSYMVFVNSVS